MIWTLLLLLTSCAHCRAEVTNNSVNEQDESIVWGELAPDRPYKTVGYEVDGGGLDPFYNLAVSFIGSSLPEEPPFGKQARACWWGLALFYRGKSPVSK